MDTMELFRRKLGLTAFSIVCVLILTAVTFGLAHGDGTGIVSNGVLLTTPVIGLGATGATSRIVSVKGEPFTRALQVTIGREMRSAPDATELCLPISIPVKKGDWLLGSFYVRGKSFRASVPAQVTFLLDTSAAWHESIARTVVARRDSEIWKRTVIPFMATEDYPAGVGRISLRFALGPQQVELGGLSVVNSGTTLSPDQLDETAARECPLGAVSMAVDRSHVYQKLVGFGGDFCNPRYGSTEPMDKVGDYVLAHMSVAQARVGIPLNLWAPERGVYKDSGAAHAALLQMQILARRHIPIIGTVWEAASWMLPGKPEAEGVKSLPPGNYPACIEAIAQFLVTARDRYGVVVADVSFNEPDAGNNFRFSPSQMSEFIRQAGPQFRALDLPTKFLVGDTSNGMAFADYVRPILADREIAPYLGPLAFHCWDALSAPIASDLNIAAIGRLSRKPIWCTEVGYDYALWQKPNAFASWDNALNTASAYAKTLRYSGVATMDYWTYEDNYPLVSDDGARPYPIFNVVRQMQFALPPGAHVIATDCSNGDLETLASDGPSAGEFSILMVNPVGAGEVTLSGLPARSRVSVVISDGNEQNRTLLGLGHTSIAGTLKVTIPARSVVTVVGNHH